jgi:enoyl-[acyl-carrier protein] reductase I
VYRARAVRRIALRAAIARDIARGAHRPQRTTTGDDRLGFLDGKKGLILGVANKRSVAWACAKALQREGMELALTYANERLEGNVRDLAADLGVKTVLPCDVTSESDIDGLVDTVGKAFGQLDCFVHAVAFAKREELTGTYLDTSKEGYHLAQEVSAYSLPAVSRRMVPLMEGRDGSIITLTYIGSERVIPNYNVMGVAKAALEASVRYLAHDLGPRGIRVNAISSGPIRTLSASGIDGFSAILDHIAGRAPLRRNVTAEEVGDVCAFLASSLSRGITGSTIFVDAGYHIMGL